MLLLAWIGWSVYVTSDHGVRAGLGVVIAWPAMLAALALISLPFIGAYLLIRRLSASEDDGEAATVASETADPEEDSGDEAEDSADEDEDPDEEEEDSAEEDEDEDSEEDEESDEAEEPESSAKGSSKS